MKYNGTTSPPEKQCASTDHRKKTQKRKVSFILCLCTADIKDPQKEGRTSELQLSWWDTDENTPSFLTVLRAPLPPSFKLLAQTNQSPCKIFVLGTRANRRLFKTELFLIYVEYFFSFFYVCTWMCLCKEDTCVCKCKCACFFGFCFCFVLCWLWGVCVRVCVSARVFECIKNRLK